MIAILRSVWTQQERLAASAVRSGPPRKRLAGGWLADLAALGKAIVLCRQCEAKWQPGKYGYRHKVFGLDLEQVAGECDACGGFCSHGKLFLPEGGVR